MPTSPARRLEWAPRALSAYLETLTYIADEDPRTAELVRARVERALRTVVEYPGIGAPATRRGDHRLPIANTGHVIVYRVTVSAVRILVWYRARQNVLSAQLR